MHNLLQRPHGGDKAHKLPKETTITDILILRPVREPLPVNVIKQERRDL